MLIHYCLIAVKVQILFGLRSLWLVFHAPLVQLIWPPQRPCAGIKLFIPESCLTTHHICTNKGKIQFNKKSALYSTVILLPEWNVKSKISSAFFETTLHIVYLNLLSSRWHNNHYFISPAQNKKNLQNVCPKGLKCYVSNFNMGGSEDFHANFVTYS